MDPSKTVAENVMEGLAEQKGYVDRFEEVSMKLGEVTDPDEMTALIDEQADLQEKIDAADAWDLSRTVEIAMDALRCADGEAEVMKLSGGERRRVALCRLLLQKPDLLLLDEPTNHLDAESIAWLERHLREYEGTVVMVTHDRYFLDRICSRIIDLGNYERFLGISLSRDHNITTGKVYAKVIERERKGDYLGKTVQVVPHVTDAIQDWIASVAAQSTDGKSGPPDVCLSGNGSPLARGPGRRNQRRGLPPTKNCWQTARVMA